MATGTRLTYTDTNLNKTLVSPMMDMIDWTEAPLLNEFGVNNASKFGFQQLGTKGEWMEDTMSPRSGSLDASLNGSATTVAVQTGEGNYLKKGDVIRIEDELIWISSTSANAISVMIRGFGGTTNTSHADDTPWDLVGSASLEGDDFVTGHTTTISRPYNHTQILREAVKVSGSEQENPKWDGETNTLARHLGKLMGDGGKSGKLPILLEQSGIYGRRAAGTDSTARAMGGLTQYVTTNVNDLGGAALLRKNIEDSLMACFEAGGSPETLIVGGHARRKITNFYEKYITTTQDETRGGAVIDTVKTDFGTLTIVYWRWARPNELLIVEKGQMGWCEMRPFRIYDRASIGDYEVKEVLGEYTFVVRNEKAHAIVKNFSTTA